MDDQTTSNHLFDKAEAASGADGEPVAGETAAAQDAEEKPRRARKQRTFPASSFSEALPLADAIQSYAAGQRVRRLTLFEKMGQPAESGSSRQLVTNSNQYGITKGGYTAEWLELTQDGRIASSEDVPPAAQLEARLKLAIANIQPFNVLYERLKGNRLPTRAVIRDAALDNGIDEDAVDECVETFLANARDLGLVANLAGAERMLTSEFLLENRQVEGAPEIKSEVEAEPHQISPPIQRREANLAVPTRGLPEVADVSQTCFVISPIGSEGSDQRKHADLMRGSLIEPALEELDLQLVRADMISTPGLITAQVIDYIVRAPLVIADLSFANPNVYYELALRHSCRRPVVQIIRSSDRLPFDVGQFRTVTIDMTDIFTLVPQLESYRAEISRQCRAAMADEASSDTPLSVFYPTFWEQFIRS